MSESYIFIIDTDEYSGNFEREMCACVCGQTGDCEVGEKQKEKFIEEMGIEKFEEIEDIIERRADEHGCHRPTECWSTPGYFNNGLGGEFKDGQEEEALEAHTKYCIEESNKKYYDNDKANKAHKEEWLENSKEKLNKYPASLSVAIFFYERPSQELIGMMKERAEQFTKGIECGYPRKKRSMKISGFRLLKETTTITTENLEV